MQPITLEQWPIGRLIEYARNPRKNDAVVDRMCASIREFGFRVPIIAKSDGTVVDGHLRLKAARSLGLAEVPVVLADELSDVQIKAFRLLANRSVAWAEWDEDLLRLEMAEIEAAEFDTSLTGFDDREIQKLLSGADDPDEELDDAPEPPKEPVSRPGDLWLCDEHRVMCGDATNPAHIGALLGEAADMCFTDPPYNVNYTGSISDKLKGKSWPIANDALGQGHGAFLHAACVNILEATRGAVYICMSSSELATLQTAFREAGGHWSTFIIWAKDRFTLGRSDYHRQYEPILYGWKEGGTHHWCGARDRGDVWLIDRPIKHELHPTMKPVALVERAIRNSSKRRGVVLDPFGGSGTTLIAAERSGRRARLLELDPKYADVIVQRWRAATGKEATRRDDGATFGALAAERQAPAATPQAATGAAAPPQAPVPPAKPPKPAATPKPRKPARKR